MEKYEEMLEAVYANLPERALHKERFEMPVFEVFSEGNKTVIKNFSVVADKLRRKKSLLLKWLSKELAVPISDEGERAILQRKASGELLNKKLEEFVLKFVICRECKKPDTHIEELGHGLRILVCEACGARTPIKD